MKKKNNLNRFIDDIQQYYQRIPGLGNIDYCVYQTTCITHQAQSFSGEADREAFLKSRNCNALHFGKFKFSEGEGIYLTIPYFSEILDTTIEDYKKNIPSVYRYRAITRLGKRCAHLLFGNKFKISLLNKPLLVESLRQKARRRSLKKLQSISNHKLIGDSSTDHGSIEINPDSVVIVMNSLEQSGAERFALKSIDFLKEKFGNCTLYVENISTNKLLTMAQEKGIELNLLPINQIIPERYRKSFLVNVVKNSRAAYLHIHHSQLAYSCLPEIKAISPKTIIADTLHLIELPHGGLPRISGYYSNFIDYHHVISKKLQQFLVNVFDIKEEHCKLGYLYERKTNLITERSNTHDEFVVTFIGRMVLQKRPYMIVLLANYIKTVDIALFKVLKFKMVGDGFLLKGCKDLVVRYGLEQHFDFIDYVDNSKKCLQESDIFILPSENEGIALSCMEAIEENCLVLSCDVGAQAELIPKESLLDLEPSLFLEQAYCQMKSFIEDNKQQKAIIQVQHDNLSKLSNSNWITAFEQIYCGKNGSDVKKV